MSSNNTNANKNRNGGNGGNRNGGNGGNRNGGNRNGGNRSGGNRNGGGGGEGGRYSSIEQVNKAWRREMVSSPSTKSDEFLKTKGVETFLKLNPMALGEILKYIQNTRDEFAVHHRECLKTARMFDSQGFYTFAEQWKRYAKNPDGEYPKCLHEELKAGMFTHTDRNTGVVTVDHEGYEQLLNKGSGRFGKEPTWGAGACRFVERKEELTIAQLGEIREEDPRKKDGKTHPMRLIALVNASQKKYPEMYAKNDVSAY